MQRHRFCVYNQTCECFLSLGVVAADTVSERLKVLIGKCPSKCDEGLWLVPSRGFHTFGTAMTAPLDLVYLDADCRVVHVVDSLPRFCIAPLRREAASLLALPAHTIYSSQTQPGNQLLICMAEEMEFRLRNAPSVNEPMQMSGFEPQTGHGHPRGGRMQHPLSLDQDRARRHLWPKLIAYDRNGDSLVVHGIRDSSATGLYLLTDKRWPLGTLVTMTLQSTGGPDEGSKFRIAVQLKVVRWGSDGVGLAFAYPAALGSAPWLEAESGDGDQFGVFIQSGGNGASC